MALSLKAGHDSRMADDANKHLKCPSNSFHNVDINGCIDQPFLLVKGETCIKSNGLSAYNSLGS